MINQGEMIGATSYLILLTKTIDDVYLLTITEKFFSVGERNNEN